MGNIMYARSVVKLVHTSLMQMSMQKFTLRDSLFLVASVGKLSRQDRFLEVITENFFSIQEYLSTFWTLAQITLADIRFWKFFCGHGDGDEESLN